MNIRIYFVDVKFRAKSCLMGEFDGKVANANQTDDQRTQSANAWERYFTLTW